MPGDTHYCANCHWYRELRDGVHCGWCLDWFYKHSKMPVHGDRMPTTLERLWAEVDAVDG